ncbi:protein of unknown function [Xenorhabdus doucetiae]|uniref:Uncharacterized protein n=1 Tax=Xenorhabdus doucetiae TaxID=351671 RepID=A0A068QPX1_9GAMM|nr:protein of unknown function [Xenorhabdus doucetiae]
MRFNAWFAITCGRAISSRNLSREAVDETKPNRSGGMRIAKQFSVGSHTGTVNVAAGAIGGKPKAIPENPG